jgi:hypothetical protein
VEPLLRRVSSPEDLGDVGDVGEWEAGGRRRIGGAKFEFVGCLGACCCYRSRRLPPAFVCLNKWKERMGVWERAIAVLEGKSEKEALKRKGG